MLHAVQASILTGQAFGPRLVVMSWQLERKLLTASGVLQAFHLQQLSRISRFQGMFLDEHLYLLLCFIVSMGFSRQILQPHHSHERQQRSHRHLQAGVGVENSKLRLQIWKISAKVWCMPCGTKAVDGWIHLLWGLWGPPSGDQTWSNVKRAWSVRCPCCVLLLNWMMLLIVYHVLQQKCRTGVKIPFFFFFFVFCCVPPTLLRTEDVAELYLLFHCFATVDWREVCRPIVFNSFHMRSPWKGFPLRKPLGMQLTVSAKVFFWNGERCCFG